MKRPARVLLASAVLVVSGNISGAQVDIRPTPSPLVTAENETWYRTGEALAFAGSLYYPGGAAIHFLPNEMVRTGLYRGIPLYSRTTLEPFSVVFVPVGRGMMRPYERRRDLDLAGTHGSTAPAISPALSPSVSATTTASAVNPPASGMAQAAAPPVVGPPLIVDEPIAPPPARTAAPSTVEPVGTAGREAAPAPERPARIRPGAANAIYFEFDNTRWFSAGPPVSLDVRTLTQVGESRGFPVYATRRGDTTIYVPIARGADTFGRYSKRR